MPSETAESILDSIGQVRDELRRADAKATALVSLVGALFAGEIALTSSGLVPAAQWLMWLASTPIAGSVVLLLVTIRPYLGKGEPGSFLHAARSTPAEMVELAADRDTTPERLALTWVTVSQIARRKYQRIRAAVQLLLVGIGVLLVALATSALGGA